MKYAKLLSINIDNEKYNAVKEKLILLGFVELCHNTWIYERRDDSIIDLIKESNKLLDEAPYVICDICVAAPYPYNLIYAHNCYNAPQNCITEESLTKFDIH